MTKILKSALYLAISGFAFAYSSQVFAIFCPITVSTNSTSATGDSGMTNCVITINSGVTLSASNAVSLSGLSSAVTNNGTISFIGAYGINANGINNVGSITNNGTISTPSTGTAIYSTGANLGSITNTGSVSTTTGNGIRTTGTNLGTINNSGTISSTGSHGIYNYTGTVTNFINTGTVSGGGANSGLKIGGSYNTNLTNFTNAGTMRSTGIGYGVLSNPVSGTIGTIGTFNNGQGGDATTAAKTALTYYGKLPTYYNIIVKSPTQYGQLAVTSPLAYTTTFGIYSGGVSGVAASVLAAGTYASVLTGVSSSNILGGTTGTYGSYGWTLNNVSGTTWDLVVTGGSSGSTGGDTSNSSVSPTVTNVTSGTTIGLSSIGVSSTPVLAGGTIVLSKGERSSQALTVLSEGGTIAAPSSGAAQLSGTLSGTGRVTFNGSGMTVLSGVNTYTGGTSVESGTLSLLRGTLGSGDVYVAPGAQLVGTGSIAGPVTVAGLFKPGNSPGYIDANANVVMANGSVYQQDIAGTTQSSASSPVGATGYYSYLNITGGQFIINAGSILTPALSNLFNSEESGYGSTPYTPALGDRFRILTADGGISGKFSSITQPAELTAGTQFVSFYNMNNSNSLDLAVVPSSYSNTISFASGNKNAQSVGSVLDKITLANTSGSSTSIQDQLLYSISNQTTESGIASYAQSLAGEVYAAAVAVIAQTTQRVQQAVLTRLGDTLGLELPNSITNAAGNSVLMNTTNTALNGGLASYAVSTNPNVNPAIDAQTFNNGNVWGDLAYQKGNRASDSYSGGWNSNLYQLVFGSDFIKSKGLTVGGGFALSSSTLNPTYGSGTIQQGSIFAYGKMPFKKYVVDAMASIGLNSSDLSRGDITDLSSGFRNKNISGNDALVSLGLSRPIDVKSNLRVTPFARVTWQMVTQSSINEGDVASALKINSYSGNGVRGVIGAAVGSTSNNPMTEKYTYRAYVGVGADSSGLLNPTMNASLAGLGTNITTPNAGAAFVQAGLYGTAKIADNAYAYAGLSGEARSGQTLGAVNVGVRVQF